MKDRQSNARRMSGLVERWRGSGRPLSAFARSQGVTRGKLEYWRRRLHVSSRGRGKGEVTFAPVELVSASVAVVPVEVTLPDGVRLAIASGATAELLAVVMEALRRGC
jgi:transposase-like protein